MLDQDTAHALLTITTEAGATVALVGDRAQLPAVGRGGVLDMAAQIRGRTYDMTELHRFADAEYATLTLTMRDRENPGEVFDRLTAMGLVILHADEEQAQQLGVAVERTRLVLIVVASLVTATAVAVSGVIGFVGLIVPHAVRLVWGPDHRFLLPMSALIGAVFMIIADGVARTLLASAELPVGVVTAFFGAPFFLYLLRQKKQLLFR